MGSLRGQDTRALCPSFTAVDTPEADQTITVRVNIVGGQGWVVDVVQPVRFHLLRHLEFGDDVSFCQVLRKCTSIPVKGGKSGAAFWVTACGKLVLKEVKRAEAKQLSETAMAGPLAHRLAQSARGAPSALCGVYGLFKIRRRGIHRRTSSWTVIIMQNLRCCGISKELSADTDWKVFDVKGVGRVRQATADLEPLVSTMAEPLAPTIAGLGLETDPVLGDFSEFIGPTAESTATPQEVKMEMKVAAVSSWSSERDSAVSSTPWSIFDVFKLPSSWVGGQDADGDESHMSQLSDETDPPANIHNEPELNASSSPRLETEGQEVLAKSMASQRVHWDAGFLDLLGGLPLVLCRDDFKMLQSALETDTQILEDLEIVDYSLLLSIKGSAAEGGKVRIGIIDYLQPYTLSKQLEFTMKKYIFGRDPTVVGPVQYRKRLFEFFVGAFEAEPE